MAFDDFTGRFDASASQAARHGARAVSQATRLLRIPIMLLWGASAPFILALALLALLADGDFGLILWIMTGVLAVTSLFCGQRFWRTVKAGRDEQTLASQFTIAISLSERANQAQDVFKQITSTDGLRLFSRLRGLWRGARMAPGWIDGVSDLSHARYFLPPTINSTVLCLWVSLALVPASAIACLFALIGSIAR